jgi:quercetin dioxygenase-like cupin family protein
MMPRYSRSAILIAAVTAITPMANDRVAAHETVRPAFSEAIPNLPGKTLTSVIVSYPPGVSSKPHTHARSAYIYAFVISGAIRSKVDYGPAKIYRAGESWSEAPGAHHVVSENASKTAPARLLAVFIADTGDNILTTPDN